MENFTHVHPTLYCSKLAEVTPKNLNTSYLVCGGSEAVETGLLDSTI